jgi:sulfate adenylyltransferase
MLFKEKGLKTVVGFQTRNPPHRAHEYLQKCALESVDGLFINPVIGRKKAGDFTDELILQSYQCLIDNFYPRDRAVMSILPTEMRYAGPKEAIFHALVRKNFGCTHFIVGRDHAGVGDYYDTYAAHRIFDDFDGRDLDITPMFYDHTFFCRKCGNMGSKKTCPHGREDQIAPAGKRIRATITENATVEPELMRPEIVEILKASPKPFVE